MNTDVMLKPKKKFSIGGVFCLLTAIVILGFSAWDLLVAAISAMINLFSFIQRIGWSDHMDFAQTAYITNIIGNVGAVVAELCTVVTVVALALFGILTLFKVKTRLLGVIFLAPAAVSALSIMITLVAYVARLADWLAFDVRTAVTYFVQYLLWGTVAAIPLVVMAVCWVALAIVVLALGGSKKYSKARAIISIVAAAVMALLFVGAEVIGFGSVLVSNGMTIISWFMDVFVYGFSLFGHIVWRSLLNMLISVLYAALKCGTLGILYGLTVFFSVKWIVAPYKK